MICVDQTRFDGPAGGNCLAACLASILEVDLHDIDSIALSIEGLWWPAMRGMLQPFGLHPMHYSIGGKDFPPIAPPGIHIACNAKHATVAIDGKIVWDPHPSRKGLKDITEWILLLPIAARS